MGKLDSIKKQKMVNNINNGKSINKISSTLNIPKSTIYYYYKKIKGKRYQEPQYDIEFSEKEGEIVGIFAGDGSQNYNKINCGYQTNIHFGNNVPYVTYVKKLYETYFNKKWASWQENTKDGFIKYRLRVVDKKIFNYFEQYLNYEKSHKHDTVQLKPLSFPQGFKKGFLRGFLDTDGTISLSDNRIRIVYYTTSEILAQQIKKMCEEFKIFVSIQKRTRKQYKTLFNVYVLASSIDRFLNLIQPFKKYRLGR